MFKLSLNVRYIFLAGITRFAGIASFRLAMGFLTIWLFVLAFTPYCLPTYPIALVPLVLLWRSEQFVSRTWFGLIFEALLIGYLLGCLITGFVPQAVPLWGSLLHGVGCGAYSMLTVVIAVSLHITRGFSLPIAAAFTDIYATILEFAQARIFGVAWVLSNSSLAVAMTPLAQWSGILTPCGLAGALYWINFSLLPDRQHGASCWRWFGPFSALGLTAGLWFGGSER